MNQCLFNVSLFAYLAVLGLSGGMWDLVPWPGIEPGHPALEAQNFNHWTAREVTVTMFNNLPWRKI